MSASYLEAIALREEDSNAGANPRKKITQLSDKVVDSNPYSRLMCATLPSGNFALCRTGAHHFKRCAQGAEEDGCVPEVRGHPF